MTEFNLSDNRKKIFNSWLKLDDVRIKALNPETLDILFIAIEKQDKEFIKLLKEIPFYKIIRDFQYTGMDSKANLCVQDEIDKLAGSKLSNSIGENKN